MLNVINDCIPSTIRSPLRKWSDYYREYFGPVYRAFEALDTEEQKGLHRDLTQLWTEHNTLGKNETAVDAGILEVVVTL